MSRAPPARVLLSADETATRDVCEGRSLAVTQCDVDVLTLASLGSTQKRRHDTIARVETSCEICHGNSNLDGRAIPSTSDVHQAELSLDHDIVARTFRVGSRLAIACDRGVDETGIDGPEGFVVHAVLLQGPWEVVLDKYVALDYELVQDIDALLVLK